MSFFPHEHEAQDECDIEEDDARTTLPFRGRPTPAVELGFEPISLRIVFQICYVFFDHRVLILMLQQCFGRGDAAKGFVREVIPGVGYQLEDVPDFTIMRCGLIQSRKW